MEGKILKEFQEIVESKDIERLESFLKKHESDMGTNLFPLDKYNSGLRILSQWKEEVKRNTNGNNNRRNRRRQKGRGLNITNFQFDPSALDFSSEMNFLASTQSVRQKTFEKDKSTPSSSLEKKDDENFLPKEKEKEEEEGNGEKEKEGFPTVDEQNIYCETVESNNSNSNEMKEGNKIFYPSTSLKYYNGEEAPPPPPIEEMEMEIKEKRETRKHELLMQKEKYEKQKEENDRIEGRSGRRRNNNTQQRGYRPRGIYVRARGLNFDELKKKTEEIRKRTRATTIVVEGKGTQPSSSSSSSSSTTTTTPSKQSQSPAPSSSSKTISTKEETKTSEIENNDDIVDEMEEEFGFFEDDIVGDKETKEENEGEEEDLVIKFDVNEEPKEKEEVKEQKKKKEEEEVYYQDVINEENKERTRTYKGEIVDSIIQSASINNNNHQQLSKESTEKVNHQRTTTSSSDVIAKPSTTTSQQQQQQHGIPKQGRSSKEDVCPIFMHPLLAKLFNCIMLAKHTSDGKDPLTGDNEYVENMCRCIMNILTDQVKDKQEGWFWGKTNIPRGVTDIFGTLSSVQETGILEDFLTLSCVYTSPYITQYNLDVMFLKFLFQRKLFSFLTKQLMDQPAIINLYKNGSIMKKKENHVHILDMCNILERMDYDFGYPPPVNRNEKIIVSQFVKNSERLKNHFVNKKNTLCYNMHLGVIMKRMNETGPIPHVIHQMIKEIKKRGIQEEGIFRIAANKNDMNNIKKRIDAGKPVDFTQFPDIHLISGLLKDYFRSLPEPVTTYDLFHEFMKVLELWEEKKVPFIKSLIGKLPIHNQMLLKKILKLLYVVSQYEEQNRMGVKNISIVWGSNLFRPETKNRFQILQFHPKTQGVTKILVQKFPEYKEIFPKKVFLPKVDVPDPQKISVRDYKVLKEIGDEEKNSELKSLVRDQFCSSLIVVLENGVKQSFFSNVHLWDVFEGLKSITGDLSFRRHIYFSALLKKADSLVNKHKEKGLRKRIMTACFLCDCLNIGILKDFISTFIENDTLRRKYYNKKALINDATNRVKIINAIEKISNLPFSISLTQVN